MPNRAGRHPYQENEPEKYAEVDRWFLLDTNLDAPRPWQPTTDIPVFSLALVQGDEGKRRWLVYAHSPLADREDVEITIPDFGEVTCHVPRAGEFYLVDERDGRIQSFTRDER